MPRRGAKNNQRATKVQSVAQRRRIRPLDARLTALRRWIGPLHRAPRLLLLRLRLGAASRGRLPLLCGRLLLGRGRLWLWFGLRLLARRRLVLVGLGIGLGGGLLLRLRR